MATTHTLQDKAEIAIMQMADAREAFAAGIISKCERQGYYTRMLDAIAQAGGAEKVLAIMTSSALS